MREVGLLRRHLLRNRDRLAEREVRVVRLIAQRVEHQYVHTLDQTERYVRDVVAVGEIRKVAETEAENRQLPMPEGNRNDLDPADEEGAPHRVLADLRHAATRLKRSLEDVRKLPANLRPGLLVGVTRNRAALQLVEAPQIVEPEDVVRVRVGEENRIDMGNVMRQHLLTQIRRRIHQDLGAFGDVDVDRRTQPSVSYVG